MIVFIFLSLNFCFPCISLRFVNVLYTNIWIWTLHCLDKIKPNGLGQNWLIWSWFIIRLLGQTERDKFRTETKASALCTTQHSQNVKCKSESSH